MERKMRGIFAATLIGLSLVGCGGSTTSRISSAISEDPTLIGPDDGTFVDRSSAIGFYTDGAVEAAAELPSEGPGYLKIFRLRDRGHGTATMIRAIQLAAAAWRAEFPIGDRVQIGDIGDWNGGSVSGHASHQNGLDADFAYLKANHAERDPNTNGPGGFAEKFVVGGRLTSNFDLKRNWAIIRNLVLRGNVGRIFVDPVIKRAFCAASTTLDPGLASAKRTEVLRRLRPITNHADHFHLRLKCPTGHAKCVAQTEPPTGSGCSDVDSASLAADDELGEDEG